MDRFESGGLYLAHYFYEIRIASIALLFIVPHRQPSSRLAADLPASITIKLNYEQARAYRNSRGYVLWPGEWKDLTVKVLL